MFSLGEDEKKLVEAALPDKGEYFWLVRFKGGKVDYNEAFTSPAELIGAAEGLLEEGIKKGEPPNLHYAVASFSSDTSRKDVNATHHQAFYVDIDVRSDKDNHYKTETEAITAYQNFCDSFGLPIPTSVRSGGGLHLYWTLKEPLETKDWKEVAQQLQFAAQLKGFAGVPEQEFLIDPQVGTTPSHLMRFPGSTNPKYTDRVAEVSVIDFRAPIDIGELKNPFDGNPDVKEPPSPAIFNDSDENPEDTDPFTHSFREIYEKSQRGEGCELLKVHCDNPDLEYSQKYYWLLAHVARRCEDKEEGYRLLSEQTKKTGAELKKFEDGNKETIENVEKHPYTAGCKSILVAAQNSKIKRAAGICKACAYNKVPGAPLSISQIPKPADNKVEYEGPMGSSEYVVPEICEPYFRYHDGGIGGPDVNKGGKGHARYTKTDVFVERLVLDDGEDLHFALEIAVVTHSSGVVRFTMRRGDLQDIPRARRTLADKGVHLMGSQAAGLMNYLDQTYSELEKTQGTLLRRKQLGWTPKVNGKYEGFVVGDREYVGEGRDYVTIPPSDELKQFVTKKVFVPAKGGTIDAWSEIASVWGEPGWEDHCFAFFSAFGSPLFAMSTFDGCLVCIQGPSGTSKSTTLDLINSFFGHPFDLRNVVRTTFNSAMQTQGVLNSISATYDEVGKYNPKALDDLVHMISQGRGAGRMKSQVNANRENNTSWQMIAVGGSNVSIRKKLQANQRAGTSEIMDIDAEEMRLIEIPINAPPDVDNAIDRFRQGLLDNAGVAGPVYVNHLITHQDEAREEVEKKRKEIEKEYSFEPKERFRLQVFASSLTGARIAKRLGLHTIDVDRQEEHALKNILGNMRTESKERVIDPVDQLSHFLNENLGYTLTLTHDIKNRTEGGVIVPAEPHQVLRHPTGSKVYIRIHQDTMKIYIDRAYFMKYIEAHAGHPEEVLAGLHAEKLMLEKTHIMNHKVKKTLGGGTVLGGGGIRVVIIDGARLEGLP